ncbi:MAG: aminotransferase class V-fold PLP-dependent enzyme, partial [Pseudomonadota bacterium]
AADRVAAAREAVATLVGAWPEEVVFCSGATEANNLAILGAAARARAPGHMVSVKTEHKAVLDPLAQLAKQGWSVDLLDVQPDGRVDPDALARALRDDTLLVSVMHANNEIGTVQDIATIGQITRAKGVLLHVDAAQSIGKLPVAMHAMQIDLLSVCAHKFHGPKGVGALCVRGRPPVRLQAQALGGGHERGLRSGTLATHQIAGFGAACEIARAEMDAEGARLAGLRDALWARLQALPGVQLNGSLSHRLPGNLNVSIDGVEGESLLFALERIAVSSGSACTSADLMPSHVLRAIGCSAEQAQGSLRISFGRFNSLEDVGLAADDIAQAVARLRGLAPDA